MKMYKCDICGHSTCYPRMHFNNVHKHSMRYEDYYNLYLASFYNRKGSNCSNPGCLNECRIKGTHFEDFCSKSCSIMYRHIEPPKNFGFSQLHKKPEFAKMNAEKAKLQIKNPKSGFGTASLNRFKREHQGMTPSELTLWSNPRFRDLNPIPQDSRFRYTEGWGNGTQGPTLDFSIPNFNLNIEIDGWGHTKESDEERDKFLDEKGWTVLRFTNDQVKTNDNKVVDQIHNYINILSLVL